VLLTFACEGSYIGIYPAVCSYIFGMRSGGEVFSFLISSTGLASLFGFILSFYVISAEEDYIIFYWATAMSAGSLVLLMFFN
jgi:hypothetical protein